MRIDYGAKFEEVSKTIDNDMNVREVRERCAKFLFSLVEQMEKRLPENKETLKNCSNFNTEKFLDISFSDLSHPDFCPDLSLAENKFWKLKLLNWTNFGWEGGSTEQFWGQGFRT